MNEFESVGKVSDFKEGVGQAVPVDGRMVAIFLKEGRFYAIDDMCPHMGASLAEGQLDGDSVSCPWHAWRFCIKDGTWEDNPRAKIDTFEVKVEGEDILVRPTESAEDKETGA